ncbi:FHA domain-containing protein [Paraphaeosphaeria sporulosa]
MAASGGKCPPIDITLRSSDKLDEYTTRTFTLRPGSMVQIGRAPKNAAKPELMVGPANAFIDSPTISREHAVLTATPPPAACVCIQDKGSMHGTMVNGVRLDPLKAQRLNNGDVLQFGANVTREQLFYTARQFTFESSLPSYPNGITVPESSDDEDVEVDDELSCPPSYGTQTNPLTIDIDHVNERRLVETEDADHVPEVRANASNDNEFDDDELDKHLQETTLPLDSSHDAQERSPSPDDGDEDDDDPMFYPEHLPTANPKGHGYISGDDVFSEGDAASISSGEDENVSQLDRYGIASADSDESQSDGDMELAEEDDGEEEEEGSASSPFSMQIKLLEQQNKTRLMFARQEQDSQKISSEVRPVSPETQEGLSGASTTIDFGNDSSELGLTAPPAPPAPFVNSGPATLLTTEGEAPKLPDTYFTSNDVFSDSYHRTYLDGMEPLPPRPAAPRPMWPSMVDYTSSFSPPANASNFPAAYSPHFVGNYSGPAEQFLSHPYAAPHSYSSAVENPWEQSKSSAALPISGVQTPPPAPSSEFSSPPVRRTEVSIREIVEDVTQQPPTPTSVTGGLKRKAEVLDEAVEGPEEEPMPAAQAPAGATAPDATAVEAVNAIDQRPKKRPRSLLTKAASYVASGLIGAAGAVVLLTSVPNDFFVA